jgi:hypothetical protein
LRRGDELIARAAAAIAAIGVAQNLLANMMTAQYAFRPPSIASSPIATPVPATLRHFDGRVKVAEHLE